MMQVKMYEELTDAAKMIRTKVFMEEQGFQNEFDATDDSSLHFVVYEESVPVATCRLYYSKTRNSYVIGRIAVLEEFRGRNYGSTLICNCEDVVKNLDAHRIELSAQVRVAAFYEKNGYTATGDIHMDEGCSHVWMRKEM
ncbi:MAG: GNAT family N-acetyltransferase [Eubacterium sp.]|nr:GNAT family N-acetyltransferase [Eubacterium sp.]